MTLDLVALPTHEARALWAKQRARQLARVRMDRAAGVAPPAERKPMHDAVDHYLDAVTARLRPNTVAAYRQSLGRFRRWADRAGIDTTAGIGTSELAALRDHLIREPKAVALRGGKRGSRRTTADKRAVRSINADLRSIKAMLNDLRRRGLLPHLHRDDIADALAVLSVPRETPPFLAPAALRKLLAAALRHDAECYAATREEHAGRRARGTTARNVPIASFVAVVLLTGMRRGEALALTWSLVDLDALDHEGRVVGEIRLPAKITKTQRARTIGLEVSPALRRLLAAMKLRDGRGEVFGYTTDLVETARARMISRYGAPTFDWQTLRSTCATYLTNAPGIFGAATVFLSAKQLGHSVSVAERHYLGVHRGIARDARTLEAAMQIEGELDSVLDALTPRVAAARTTSTR